MKREGTIKVQHDRQLHRLGPAMLTAVIMATAGRAEAAPLEKQRVWYEDAKVALRKGDLKTFRQLRRKLSNYPLHPYLDYQEFVERLETKSVADFTAFVDKYRGRLPFEGTVRSRYLLQLADRGAWKQILEVQPRSPRDEALRCVYYRALYETGNPDQAWPGAKKLWLSGRSISDRCDPLFEAWDKAGQRTDALVLDRVLLAFRKRNGGLIRYLGERLTGPSRAAADQAADLYRAPDGVGAFAKASKVTDFNQRLARRALERLAKKDPAEAVKQFDPVVTGQRYDDAETQRLADYVAARLMDTDDPDLARWRDQKLASSRSASALESRIRLAIRTADWASVGPLIDRLPAADQNSLRWTFWRGRLFAREGHKEKAAKILTPILGRPNYYSAAAATLLGRAIEYPNRGIPAETASLEAFQPALDRVAELVELKKFIDAKREWRLLMYRASTPDLKLALAVHAYKMKWYYLTVQASIIAELWDYPVLRFPLAFRWWFEFFGKERDLSPQTMLAIARLESALNIEARSRADARGLLQVLPSTAREIARRIRFRYHGRNSLFDPGVNIRLGSAYLKRMLDRCDGNRILAFAAYNAGYTRVRRWRTATDGQLDMYAFVEQIPFRETRGYVQNALMFEIYYARLMNTDAPLYRPNEVRLRY